MFFKILKVTAGVITAQKRLSELRDNYRYGGRNIAHVVVEHIDHKLKYSLVKHVHRLNTWVVET